jgi:primosomal protein N' (replication factor Y)
MKYAEVSVNSPIAQRRTYSYAIPPRLEIIAGQAVLVPFGEKVLQGIVMELSPVPAVEDTREIIDIIEPEPLLSPQHLQLARWISEYYLAPLFDAVALMLPPGFERRTIILITSTGNEAEESSLSAGQNKVLKLVRENPEVDMRNIEKVLGKQKTAIAVSQLIKKGLLQRSYKLEPLRMRPKEELYISQAIDSGEEYHPTGDKQQVLIEFLKKQGHPVPWTEARKQTGCSKSTADSLVRKGMARYQEVEVKREPVTYNNIVASLALPLVADQKTALDSIKAAMERAVTTGRSAEVFLLHGVTGSGKTEIYLQALAEAVKLGKKGIVLVPEIALTPQTIERFASRFRGKVGLFHSRLSPGEQYDEWHRIKNGEFDVVIGSRSAIFTPQPNLGLIIIDEEHEWTYKQENSPYYHARDAAIKLAELTGAVVVLGSATPDVTTYYKSIRGDYRLLTLPERVVPYQGAELPAVEVVDMREELKAGNRSIFSRSLAWAINEAIASREQVILFLNRRGGATFIQCRRCGFVLRCRRCDLPMVQHITGDMLVCHQCNYKMQVPKVCPNCSSRQIKFLGAGTQKLEQEAGYNFPRARHLRWDSDVTGRKSAHEQILRRFREREADILIGTQMIAKGLDMPSVTLVGVVLADISLNLPDFRAGERTFQLLSQVAGRAGRGPGGGKVIIQTYSPENYAIRAAARHDYISFYNQEIDYRRELYNPPFTQLARLVYVNTNDSRCQREAERMRALLVEEMKVHGIEGIDILGPAQAYIHRLRGRFRWQLILRGNGLASFLANIPFPQGWTIDIDPMNMI